MHLPLLSDELVKDLIQGPAASRWQNCLPPPPLLDFNNSLFTKIDSINLRRDDFNNILNAKEKIEVVKINILVQNTVVNNLKLMMG